MNFGIHCSKPSNISDMENEKNFSIRRDKSLPNVAHTPESSRFPLPNRKSRPSIDETINSLSRLKISENSLPSTSSQSVDTYLPIEREGGILSAAKNIFLNLIFGATNFVDWKNKNSEFKPLKFTPLVVASKLAAAEYSVRDFKIIEHASKLIDEHARGIYENVLEKYHRAGAGLSEIGALLDSDIRAYLQKPGNLYEQMFEFAGGLTENETKMVYTLLVEIDKKSASFDEMLKTAVEKNDGFDLDFTLKKIKPVVDHYSSKKMAPENHKISGVPYHLSFMKISALRPNTKKFPIAITEHLAYHASTAIILDALKFTKYPKAHAKTKKIFDDEKIHGRALVWHQAKMGHDAGLVVPEYTPVLPPDAFNGYIKSLAEAKIVAALVKLKLPTNVDIETSASVAINEDNHYLLMEFIDHTLPEPVKRYAVSTGALPIGQKIRDEIKVFDGFESAQKAWHGELI